MRSAANPGPMIPLLDISDVSNFRTTSPPDRGSQDQGAGCARIRSRSHADQSHQTERETDDKGVFQVLGASGVCIVNECYDLFQQSGHSQYMMNGVVIRIIP